MFTPRYSWMNTQLYVLVGVSGCVRTCAGRGRGQRCSTGEHDRYSCPCCVVVTVSTPLGHSVVFLVPKQTGLV